MENKKNEYLISVTGIQEVDGEKEKIEFDPHSQMFKAVTPGQAAVFYDGDEMLGGSTIDEVFMNDQKRRY